MAFGGFGALGNVSGALVLGGALGNVSGALVLGLIYLGSPEIFFISFFVIAGGRDHSSSDVHRQLPKRQKPEPCNAKSLNPKPLTLKP